MQKAINEITVNDDYLALVPRPTAEDFEALKEGISSGGMQNPILLTGDFTIIDGHTRYQIAKDLGLNTVPVEVRNYDNKLDEKQAVIDLNLQRRQLNNAQRAKLGLALLDIEKKKAKERQVSSLIQNNGTATVKEILPERGQARDIAARKVSLSGKTLDKAAKIKEAAQHDNDIKEEWDKALAGKSSIDKVYKKVVKAKKQSNTEKQTVAGDDKEKSENIADVEGAEKNVNDNKREGEEVPNDSPTCPGDIDKWAGAKKADVLSEEISVSSNHGGSGAKDYAPSTSYGTNMAVDDINIYSLDPNLKLSDISANVTCTDVFTHKFSESSQYNVLITDPFSAMSEEEVKHLEGCKWFCKKLVDRVAPHVTDVCAFLLPPQHLYSLFDCFVGVMQEHKFYYQRTFVWHNPSMSDQDSNIVESWSPILIFKHRTGSLRSEASKVEQKLGISNLDCHVSSILQDGYKPVSIMHWLVSRLTTPGQKVLDCFAQDGSTGIACMQLGRDFEGIVKYESQAGIANSRISEAREKLTVQTTAVVVDEEPLTTEAA